MKSDQKNYHQIFNEISYPSNGMMEECDALHLAHAADLPEEWLECPSNHGQVKLRDGRLGVHVP